MPPCAGHALPTEREDIKDTLIFRKAWLRDALRVKPETLVAVDVKGASMTPTIQDRGTVLIDTSDKALRNGQIYALNVAGDLLVKRVERLVDGSVTLRADNANYREQRLDASEIKTINVVGRVCWHSSAL